MAENKTMTQVEALEQAVDALGNFPEMADVVAVLCHMIEKRKNRTSKPRVNKEAVAFRDELIDVMEDLDF